MKQTLDTMCRSKFRSWLEMPAINGTLDVILQAQCTFGLNITDVSTKHAQCQVILRNELKTSHQCPNIQAVHSNTRTNTNIQYDLYTSAKEVVKEIRGAKMHNIVANFTSQSLVIKSIRVEAFPRNVKHCQSSVTTLPRNTVYMILLPDI